MLRHRRYIHQVIPFDFSPWGYPPPLARLSAKHDNSIRVVSLCQNDLIQLKRIRLYTDSPCGIRMWRVILLIDGCEQHR